MKADSDSNLLQHLLSLLHVNETDAPQPAAPVQLDTAQHIKHFIDQIPGGFLIYRADGNEDIIYANNALLSIFGCDSFSEFSALTGNSFRGMVHPDDLEEVEKSIAQQIAASHDDLDYVEYRITDKSGKMHWVEDYGHFVRNERTGSIFYVFISEATEKIGNKHANEQKLQSIIQEYDEERKLIRQEHLQRLEVIEGLSVNYDSILYADLDNNKVLPYRLSTRLERQFDKKLQEKNLTWFLDDYVNVWVHPEDRDFVRETTSPDSIRGKLADSPTFYLNYRTIQNGETQYLQLRMVNVGDSSRVSQVVMGYRNIDEEMLSEMNQKRLLKEALKNANLAYVAKNTFLSNMSHDMRTPLNAIFGFAALARKNIADSAAAESYITKIETAGKQILALIERVLELSYIESKDFRIAEQECDLREIAFAVYSALYEQARVKKIRFIRNLSKTKHHAVYADRDKLLQILTHIGDNAVKYTPAGGDVSINVYEEQKSKSEFSSYRFEITDNGGGIAPASLERVFEPFERENSTTQCGEYGSGLGLTIAKHLTEMMGGTITAKSKVGKGSVFTVTLTLRTCAEVSETADEEFTMPQDWIGGKILLVDDNEINLEIETDILEDLGFKVDTAENGKIAVDKVNDSAPNEYLFILMDIQMPVMNGHKAAEAIRNLPDPVNARIPIIALSANAFESDRRASIAIGMDAHLNKPMEVKLLLKTIADTLRSRKAE